MRTRRWRAYRLNLAVEVAGAAGFECKVDVGVARVKSVKGLVGRPALIIQFHNAECVGREVAGADDFNLQVVVQPGVFSNHMDILDLDVGYPGAAGDPYVGRINFGRGLSEKEDLEDELAVVLQVHEVQAEEIRPPHRL